jgi:hypothetical protein
MEQIGILLLYWHFLTFKIKPNCPVNPVKAWRFFGNYPNYFDECFLAVLGTVFANKIIGLGYKKQLSQFNNA